MTEIRLTRMYDEYLDEVFGAVEICGHKYRASESLKAVDEIAYQLGLEAYREMILHAEAADREEA